MNFTYDTYIDLINLLKKKNYNFCNYSDYGFYKKVVILRHDVDHSLEMALKMAELEHYNNVKSTFFVLLTTDFYNIFSKQSHGILRRIQDMGHEIGLHFDEKRYNINGKDDLEKRIKFEGCLLEEILNKSVSSVSMHIPSKWILENDIKFDGIINTYSKEFFKDFKYLSDSQMNWREDVLKIIREEKYDKLHILTHPIWYNENEQSINNKFVEYINNFTIKRYDDFKVNFRDESQILSDEELIL